LSGGQRQRIGLARALFGNPFLVVLDEPNSNLDPLGEQSLNDAIHQMRQAGKIVVIVAHRPSAIFAANKILSVRGGRAEMFGPKEQVLAALFPRIGQPHKPSQATGQPSGGVPVAQPGTAIASSPAEGEGPVAGQPTRQESPGMATVTSLDATRAQRANAHVS
jgi:ABC-type multidrug transport system ATPase subunit